MNTTIELSCELKLILINIKDRKSSLHKELSRIDRLISNIKHIIEFNNFCASEGYILSKTLKDALVHRRKIKDGIQLMHTLTEQLGTMPDKAEDIYTKIMNKKKEIDKKEFTSRILKEKEES